MANNKSNWDTEGYIPDESDAGQFPGFRELTPLEVKDFRQAARENWTGTQETDIESSIWHPVYVDECYKMLGEMADKAIEQVVLGDGPNVNDMAKALTDLGYKMSYDSIKGGNFTPYDFAIWTKPKHREYVMMVNKLEGNTIILAQMEPMDIIHLLMKDEEGQDDAD
jgi:hypothetical protein